MRPGLVLADLAALLNITLSLIFLFSKGVHSMYHSMYHSSVIQGSNAPSRNSFGGGLNKLFRQENCVRSAFPRFALCTLTSFELADRSHSSSHSAAKDIAFLDPFSAKHRMAFRQVDPATVLDQSAVGN